MVSPWRTTRSSATLLGTAFSPIFFFVGPLHPDSDRTHNSTCVNFMGPQLPQLQCKFKVAIRKIQMKLTKQSHSNFKQEFLERLTTTKFWRPCNKKKKKKRAPTSKVLAPSNIQKCKLRTPLMNSSQNRPSGDVDYNIKLLQIRWVLSFHKRPCEHDEEVHVTGPYKR